MLPCRSFPAQRLCHSRRGPALLLLFISSPPPETLEFTFLPPVSFNPQAAEAERGVTQNRRPVAAGIARAREVQPVLQLSSSNPGQQNLIANPQWAHVTLSAQSEQRWMAAAELSLPRAPAVSRLCAGRSTAGPASR